MNTGPSSEPDRKRPLDLRCLMQPVMRSPRWRLYGIRKAMHSRAAAYETPAWAGSMTHSLTSCRPSLGPRIPASSNEISVEVRVTSAVQTPGFLSRLSDGGSKVRAYAISTNTNKLHRKTVLMVKESAAQPKAVLLR